MPCALREKVATALGEDPEGRVMDAGSSPAGSIPTGKEKKMNEVGEREQGSLEVSLNPALRERLGLMDDSWNEIVRDGVADAAACLDEHVVGWHERVTEPLVMSSLYLCVLGQIFAPQPQRRWFGLRKPSLSHESGYGRGLQFFRELGVTPGGLGTFCSRTAKPFWEDEIKRREAGD